MELITSYFYQSQLSQAAYATLYSGMSSGVYIDALQENNLMSAAQAEAFAAEYTVIDQYTDTTTGFSGTVFEKDGAYYFAIRGTEKPFTEAGNIDWLDANFGDIGGDGIAINQALSMYNWLQRLLAAPGSEVMQYSAIPIGDTYDFISSPITVRKRGRRE